MTGHPASAHDAPQAAAPALAWAFTAIVTVAAPVELGIVCGARRRAIAITGGRAHGPRLTGTVLPGGADWQDVRPDGVTALEAHYAIRADDGTVIEVVNAGLRVASPEVSEQLARSEPVPADAYYFRTVPRFTVADGPHSWLSRTVFVASGLRRPDTVEIDFYSVR
jgi:hypothetical protein